MDAQSMGEFWGKDKLGELTFYPWGLSLSPETGLSSGFCFKFVHWRLFIIASCGMTDMVGEAAEDNPLGSIIEVKNEFGGRR
jgi:hypothetical protein